MQAARVNKASRIESDSEDDDVDHEAVMAQHMSSFRIADASPMSDGKKNKRGHGGNAQAYDLLVAANDANVTNPVKMTDKVYQQVCNAAKITPNMTGTELALRVTNGYEVFLFQRESQKIGHERHFAQKSFEASSGKLSALSKASTSSLQQLGKVLSEGQGMGDRARGGQLNTMVHGFITCAANETQMYPADKTTPFKDLAVDHQSLAMLQEVTQAITAFSKNHQKEQSLRAQLNEHYEALDKLEVQRLRSEERIEVNFLFV